VKAWLERNPRITLHFAPTSGSWLNLVEVFFSIITRQVIRHGSYRSVDDPGRSRPEHGDAIDYEAGRLAKARRSGSPDLSA
jgi:hypothetical protein